LPFPGTPIRREIDDASHAQGINLRPLIELDGLRTIASLTFDGHGPSILPSTMLSSHLRLLSTVVREARQVPQGVVIPESAEPLP
jgi:hypothetical protein